MSPPRFGPQLELSMSYAAGPPIPDELLAKIEKIQSAQAIIAKKWSELKQEATAAKIGFPQGIYIALLNIELNTDYLSILLRVETLARRVAHPDSTAPGNDSTQDRRETQNLRLVGSIPRPDGQT